MITIKMPPFIIRNQMHRSTEGRSILMSILHIHKNKTIHAFLWPMFDQCPHYFRNKPGQRCLTWQQLPYSSLCLFLDVGSCLRSQLTIFHLVRPHDTYPTISHLVRPHDTHPTISLLVRPPDTQPTIFHLVRPHDTQPTISLLERPHDTQLTIFHW